MQVGQEIAHIARPKEFQSILRNNLRFSRLNLLGACLKAVVNTPRQRTMPEVGDGGLLS
jgi:hypothetical protein